LASGQHQFPKIDDVRDAIRARPSQTGRGTLTGTGDIHVAITLANGSVTSVAVGRGTGRSDVDIGVSLNDDQVTSVACYPTLKSVSLTGIRKTGDTRI
jgi:hypothetical protein